jgi:hypothetical protein
MPKEPGKRKRIRPLRKRNRRKEGNLFYRKA